MNIIYTKKKWETLRKTNYIQRNLDDKRSANKDIIKKRFIITSDERIIWFWRITQYIDR